MPCNHKFLKDLDLGPLTFDPEVLIVGTFNPEWPATNNAGWFYGRTQNNYFWDILPRLYNEESLLHAGSDEWKAFCGRHKIAITDIIACVNDADENNAEHGKLLAPYSDEKMVESFHDFRLTDITGIINKYPTIRAVYFTRGIGDSFWAAKWKPVCDAIEARGGTARTLLTPSRVAFYQQAHNRNLHLDMRIELKDHLLDEWRSNWEAGVFHGS